MINNQDDYENITYNDLKDIQKDVNILIHRESLWHFLATSLILISLIYSTIIFLAYEDTKKKIKSMENDIKRLKIEQKML